MSEYLGIWNTNILKGGAFQLTTGANIGYILRCKNSYGQGEWVNPALYGVSSLQGTNNQIFVDGSYGIQKAGDIILTLPQDIATTSSPIFVNVNSNLTGQVLTATQSSITTLPNLTSIQGSSISSSVWPYVSTMNQDVSTSSSPSFTGTVSINRSNPTLKLSNLYMGNANSTSTGIYMRTDSVAAGLADWQLTNNFAGANIPILYMNTSSQLSIGTQSNPNSRLCYVGGTFEASGNIYGNLVGNVTGSVTGHASLDLALTGGTMLGSINLGGNNITNVGTLSGTLTTVSQPNITTLAGLTSIQGTSLSSSVWPYVSTMNQNVSTTSSPTFVIVNANISGNLTGQVLTTTQSSITTLPNLISIQSTSLPASIWSYLATQDQYVSTTASTTFYNTSLTSDTVTPAIRKYFTNTGSPLLLEAMYSSTLKRWQWYINNSEAKSNTGSDLYLAAYNDAGTTKIGDALAITRSTCNITCVGTVTAPTFIGALTGTASGNLPLSGGIMSGSINLGGNNITNVGTLSGTLSTVSQPNVTTLAGVTTIGTSGTVSILNKLLVGASSSILTFTGLFTNSSSDSQVWIDAPSTSLVNLLWSKAGTAIWQNYVPASSTDLRWYNGTDKMILNTSGDLKLARCLSVNNQSTSSSIGLNSNLPVTVGAGSTSVNGLAYFTDNTTGLNFASGTVNVCCSGANQLVATSGAITLSNGTTFTTSQTNSAFDVTHWFMKSSSANRWGIGLKNSESSGNAGSDFVMFNYTDAGSFLSDAFVITRSNNKFNPSGPVSLSTYTDNTNGNLTAGSYTPIIANVSNITVANSTAGPHFYQRIGDRVHIDGYCTIGASSSTTTFAFTITLPFSQSNFSGSADAVGQGVVYEVASATNRSTCNVSSTNAAQTINVQITTFTSAPGTSANNIYAGYSLTYRVR